MNRKGWVKIGTMMCTASGSKQHQLKDDIFLSISFVYDTEFLKYKGHIFVLVAACI